MNIGVIHDCKSDFDRYCAENPDLSYIGHWNESWSDTMLNSDILNNNDGKIFEIRLSYNNSFDDILKLPNTRIIKILSDSCSDDQNLHHCSLASTIVDYRSIVASQKSGAHITTVGRVGSHILSDFLKVGFSHEHKYSVLKEYATIYTIVRESFLETVASNIIIEQLDFKSKFEIDEDDRFLTALPTVNWSLAEVTKRFSDIKYFYDLYVYLSFNNVNVLYTTYEEFAPFYNAVKPKYKKHPYNKSDIIEDYHELAEYVNNEIQPAHKVLLQNLNTHLVRLDLVKH